MWRLIGLSAVMLVTGYFGEARTDQQALEFQMLLIL
jgi:hypothetical protein